MTQPSSTAPQAVVPPVVPLCEFWPLTRIPDIKKKMPVDMTKEQLEFFQRFWRAIENSVQRWDLCFQDLSRLIVTVLQHGLSEEEDQNDTKYRDKIARLNLEGFKSGKDPIRVRIDVLWAMQKEGENEAGHPTGLNPVKPRHLRSSEDVEFLDERRIQYLLENEPLSPLKEDDKPQEERGAQLKRLTNSELRKLYLETCQKRLKGMDQRYDYLPENPEEYPAYLVPWHQLAFEWLEIYKDKNNPNKLKGDEAAKAIKIALFYRWTQASFVAHSCEATFLKLFQKPLEGIPQLADIQMEVEFLARCSFKIGNIWTSVEQYDDFIVRWTLLKEALSDLQTLVEQHKATIGPENALSPPTSPKFLFITERRRESPPTSPHSSFILAIPKASSPPTSPASSLSPRSASISSRPSSVDPRREGLDTPTSIVASPRHLALKGGSHLGSPRQRSMTSGGGAGGSGGSMIDRPSTASPRTTKPMPIPVPAGGHLTPVTPESPPPPSPKTSKLKLSFTALLKKVDSKTEIKKLPPRVSTDVLSQFYTLLDTLVRVMDQVIIDKPTFSNKIEIAKAPNQTIAIYDLEQLRLVEMGSYLRDVFLFLEQIYEELCMDFDPKRPIQFVDDFNLELEKKEDAEDQELAGHMERIKKEFMQQNKSPKTPEEKDEFDDKLAFELFQFQRKYSRAHYLCPRSIQPFTELRTLQAFCYHQISGAEKKKTSIDDLRGIIDRNSWLDFLKTNLDRDCDRSLPAYPHSASLLKFVQMKDEEITARMPSLNAQRAVKKLKGFTFPVSKECLIELSRLKEDQLFYVYGHELADFFTSIHGLRDQLDKYHCFGPMEKENEDPFDLQKMKVRLEQIEKQLEGITEKPEELDAADQRWDQYVASSKSEIYDKRTYMQGLRGQLVEYFSIISRKLATLIAIQKARKGLREGTKDKPKVSKRSSADLSKSEGVLTRSGRLLKTLLGKPESKPEPKPEPPTPEKLRRQNLRRIAKIIPPLAYTVFTAPLPKASYVPEAVLYTSTQ